MRSSSIPPASSVIACEATSTENPELTDPADFITIPISNNKIGLKSVQS